ncbi:MAG: histidine phosphatase family protein [Candidatus Rokubacteria bacterium]|nr:histidine phosphatase family protein [Candidatus Rokubacteria bacterium]
MTRLFVVRHAETAWTVERRFSGQRDVPLGPGGQLQAEAIAHALAGQRLAAIYSSPLEHARTTAEIVAKPHRLPVQVDAALREMGFGRWEGLTRDQVAASEPQAWAVWRETPHLLGAHEGETLPAVAARVAAFVDGVRDRHGDETVVLVTHAIVVRLIVLAALGLGPDRLWSVDASPAGISEVELGREWTTVHRMNTLAHLEPAS